MGPGRKRRDFMVRIQAITLQQFPMYTDSTSTAYTVLILYSSCWFIFILFSKGEINITAFMGDLFQTGGDRDASQPGLGH